MSFEFESIDDRIFRQVKLPISKDLFGVKRYQEPRTSANCDRFIPCRAGNNWETSFATLPDTNKNSQTGKKTRETGENTRDSSVYNILLRNELFGENTEDVKSQCDERQVLTPVKNRNLFKYGTPSKVGCILQLFAISRLQFLTLIRPIITSYFSRFLGHANIVLEAQIFKLTEKIKYCVNFLVGRC